MQQPQQARARARTRTTTAATASASAAAAAAAGSRTRGSNSRNSRSAQPQPQVRSGQDAGASIPTDDDDVCPICHEAMDDPFALTRTKCKHAFHRACMEEYARRGVLAPASGKTISCPMCRGPTPRPSRSVPDFLASRFQQAVQLGDADMVKWTLRNGISRADALVKQAFRRAVADERWAGVRAILSAQRSRDILCADRDSAEMLDHVLTQATERKDADMVQAMLDGWWPNGAAVMRQRLRDGVREGRVRDVRTLLFCASGWWHANADERRWAMDTCLGENEAVPNRTSMLGIILGAGGYDLDDILARLELDLEESIKGMLITGGVLSHPGCTDEVVMRMVATCPWVENPLLKKMTTSEHVPLLPSSDDFIAMFTNEAFEEEDDINVSTPVPAPVPAPAPTRTPKRGDLVSIAVMASALTVLLTWILAWILA